MVEFPTRGRNLTALVLLLLTLPKLSQASSRTLREVSLPGTHDSGAYYLTPALSPDAAGSDWLDKLIELAERLGLPINDLITPWARAQNVSLYDQLDSGIRYLDMRACFDSNTSTWRTFHFELGNPVTTLLSDVARFLAHNRTAVVVVEVSHLIGNETDADRARLISHITTYLGAYLYPRARLFQDSLDVMVAKNWRAVVTLSLPDQYLADHPGLWPGSTIINSYADSDNLTTMMAFNDAEIAEFNNGSIAVPQGHLFKISWTLTPAADVIINGFFHPPHSLQELADTANRVFRTWVNAKRAANLTIPHIVIIDHFQTSSITSTLPPP